MQVIGGWLFACPLLSLILGFKTTADKPLLPVSFFFFDRAVSEKPMEVGDQYLTDEKMTLFTLSSISIFNPRPEAINIQGEQFGPFLDHSNTTGFD